MIKIINLARTIFIPAFGASSLVFTFNGFPAALLSYLGFITISVGCSSAIAPLFYRNELTKSQRFATIFMGCLLAVIGRAMISWGGLVSITVANIIAFDLMITGMALGILCGVYNVDNQMVVTRTNQSR